LAGRGRVFDSWAAEEEEEPGLSEAVRALNQRLNLAMTYDARATRHAKPKKQGGLFGVLLGGAASHSGPLAELQRTKAGALTPAPPPQNAD